MLKKKQKIRTPAWYFTRMLIFLVICIGAMNFSKGIYKIWQLTRMKHSEEKTLNNAIEEKEQLENEIIRLQEDSLYIEEIAREEYGMSKEGEEVYNITLPDSAEEGRNDDKR